MIALILFSIFIIVPVDSVYGKDSPPIEMGLRKGMTLPDEGPFSKEELIGTFVLPGGSRSSSSFLLNPKLYATAGVLRRGDEKGFIGSAGPSLALGRKGLPIFLVGGVRAALLGEQEYKEKDFGGRFNLLRISASTFASAGNLKRAIDGSTCQTLSSMIRIRG